MLPIAALAALLALVLLWLVNRRQRAAGLPPGKIIYADTRSWSPTPEPLYDPDLRLTGKPDYLIKHKKKIIPVEVKSTRAAQSPYDSHIFQLATYCLLIERTFGVRPPYGILHYPDRTYQIEYTSKLESSTLALLEEMRDQEKLHELPRTHESPARCRSCGFRSICDVRLS
ncbi:MAG TPA: CRISPR-associated protein Cas4 [Anaerolineales bacterium]